jgi:hypothetical protein
MGIVFFLLNQKLQILISIIKIWLLINFFLNIFFTHWLCKRCNAIKVF